jgi:hypothetical protein
MMDSKQYDAALLRLFTLSNNCIVPGSKEDREFRELSGLVEAYEDSHNQESQDEYEARCIQQEMDSFEDRFLASMER